MTSLTPQSELIATTSRPQAPPLILVVDDQPINIQILYRILKSNYEVCMATSGAQALEFCRTRKPHLILLDMIMPEMDGYAVCRALKSDETMRDVPIIFVTAQDNPDDEAQGLEAGAVDFITKPVHAAVVLARVRTHLTLAFQTEMLRSLSLIDGLTGIANRRQFDAVLEREWRHRERAKVPLSLLMIDIDFFKRYNDHYGHLAGDACIQAVAQELRSALHRPHDFVARYGGEEFACLLPDTPLEGAEHKAKDMMQRVRALAMDHVASEIEPYVTISIGVATASPTSITTSADLLSTADRFLYVAKESGRAQVRSGPIAENQRHD